MIARVGRVRGPGNSWRQPDAAATRQRNTVKCSPGPKVQRWMTAADPQRAGANRLAESRRRLPDGSPERTPIRYRGWELARARLVLVDTTDLAVGGVAASLRPPRFVVLALPAAASAFLMARRSRVVRPTRRGPLLVEPCNIPIVRGTPRTTRRRASTRGPRTSSRSPNGRVVTAGIRAHRAPAAVGVDDPPGRCGAMAGARQRMRRSPAGRRTVVDGGVRSLRSHR